VHIFETLRNAVNIEQVNFAGNYAQDAFVYVLCDVLRSPTCSLYSLNIENSSLSSVACFHIARALRRNRSLCYLHIENGNGAETSVLNSIASSIRRNLSRHRKFQAAVDDG
jgi:hypothetical protein